MGLINLKEGQTGPSAVQQLKQVFEAIQAARINLSQLRANVALLKVVAESEGVTALLASLDHCDVNFLNSLDELATIIGEHAVNPQAVQAITKTTAQAEQVMNQALGNCETKPVVVAKQGSGEKPTHLKQLLQELSGKPPQTSGGSLSAPPEPSE
jgi:hypothetical protein